MERSDLLENVWSVHEGAGSWCWRQLLLHGSGLGGRKRQLSTKAAVRCCGRPLWHKSGLLGPLVTCTTRNVALQVVAPVEHPATLVARLGDWTGALADVLRVVAAIEADELAAIRATKYVGPVDRLLMVLEGASGEAPIRASRALEVHPTLVGALGAEPMRARFMTLPGHDDLEAALGVGLNAGHRSLNHVAGGHGDWI
jgi:hypothetical protein